MLAIVKRIINIIVILGLLVGAYYGYNLWKNSRSASETLAVIHKKAPIFIYSADLEEDYTSFSKKNIGQSLLKSPTLLSVADLIDELTPNFLVYEYSIAKLTSNRNAALSLHFSRNKGISFVFYLKTKKNEEEIIENSFKQLSKQKDKPFKTKDDSRYKIYEFTANGLYLVFHKGHLIASKNLTLLEEVLHQSNEPSQIETILNDKERRQGISTSKAFLYLNYKLLYENAQKLFDRSPDELKLLKTLSNCSSLNFDFEDDFIGLSGFSFKENEHTYFLNTFDEQSAEELSIKNILPISTYSFTNFSIDDGLILKKSIHKYWWENDIPILNRWENLPENLKFEMETFYSLIGKEITLA